MSDLNVAGKKQIIRQLASTYRSTELAPDTARRIELAIDHRINKFPTSRSIPIWARAIAAAAVLVGIAVTFGILSSQGAMPGPVAVASRVEGTVTVGEGARLRKDATLTSGESLHTKANSQLEVMLGRHRLALEENSDLSLVALKQEQLQLEVIRGKATFSVSKLKRNETLEVFAADVTVHVVGTQFAVANNGTCVEVAVSEGKVKTVRGKMIDYVAAGQKRAYCADTKDKAPREAESSGLVAVHGDKVGGVGTKTIGSDNAQPSAPDVPNPVRQRHTLKDDSTSDVPVPTISHGAGQLSEDVLLFDNAHKALTKGALSTAAQLFEEYLESYPAGGFTEDAAFRLVRIAFRQQDDGAVMRYSENFMHRYGDAAGHRTAEVRILRARSLIRMRRLQSALDVLAPLGNTISNQTPRHQHQITALQFTAACEAGMAALCQEWVNAYLTAWPTGSFAQSAKKYLKN
ncbi:MAG: FecR domain-containing protein [Deltaproteobacteria bacterium]|nr:FecR domain-containing protein [Deltaproteobacteria bacterium]